MAKVSQTSGKKINKATSVALSILNIVVVLISIGLGRAYPIPAAIFGIVYFSIVLGVTIKKRNVAKTNGEDVKSFRAGIIGSCAFIALMLIVIFLESYNSQNNATTATQSPQELAVSIVQQTNAQTTYPKTEDSVTDLTGFTSDGNTIIYHEQLHDADVSSVTDASLQNLVQPKVCANTAMTNILAEGVNVEYLYTVKETGQQFIVNIQKSDCQ